MTSDQKRRLLTLFADCSDHTLTETGHRELQDLLQADAEARRLWFLYQDLTFLILSLCAFSWRENSFSSVLPASRWK